MASRIQCRSESLADRDANSDLNRSFSICTAKNRLMNKLSRLLSCWFSAHSRFRSSVMSSRCFFLRQRDRRAASRFDIIRLRFRSSSTELRVLFEPSETELLGLTGLSDSRTDKSSSNSSRVNPVPRTGSWS